MKLDVQSTVLVAIDMQLMSAAVGWVLSNEEILKALRR